MAGPPRWAQNLPRPARIAILAAVIALLLIGGVLLVGRFPHPFSGMPGPVEASIAVLPFRDMSAGGDQEYFADGMTEEILNALAQVPDLRVAARTSSFA